MTRTSKIKSMQDLLPVYFIVFAGTVMLFIYEPILMYATNMNDFWFDFGIMIIPTLKIFSLFLAMGIAFVTICYFVNRIFNERLFVYKAIVLIGSVLFLAAYIQGNWLTGDLPPLDGTAIDWEKHGQMEDIIECLSIAVISIIIIFLTVKYKFSKTIIFLARVSTIILIMLLVSLISVVASNNALKDKDSSIYTIKNFNSISENRNFFIFLVDAVDSAEFSRVLSNNPMYKILLRILLIFQIPHPYILIQGIQFRSYYLDMLTKTKMSFTGFAVMHTIIPSFLPCWRQTDMK